MKINRLYLLVAFLLLADVSYAPIDAPAPGLDNSWSFAIARGARDHLVFGRDLIFTYGPLGYLIAGVKTAATYLPAALVRLCISAAFAWAATAFLAQFDLRRYAAGVAVIAAALYASPLQTTDTIAVLTIFAIVLLATRVTYGKEWLLAYGIAAGAGMCAKFTIGVQATAGVAAVLACDLGAARTGIRFDRRVATISAAFAAGLSATLGAALAWEARPAAYVPALWLAAIAGTAVASNGAAGSRLLRACAAIAAAFASVRLLIAGDAAAFVSASLKISSGYSSAMSVAGTPALTFVGMLLLALTISAAFVNRSRLGWGGVLALASLAWLDFKEGFVRQDAIHVSQFVLPVCVTLAALTLCARGRVAIATSAFALCVALATLCSQNAGTVAFDASRFEMLPATLAGAFAGTRENEAYASGLAPDRFAPAVAEKLASMPVDVQPWETAAVFANDLRWSPEPVFQSYSAYVPALDAANAASLLGRNRRVLVDVRTIDRRNFMAESPRARRALLCDYRLDPSFRGPVATGDGTRYAVLAPAAASRCTMRDASRAATVAWDRPLAVPRTRGALTFAALTIPYSPIGTVVKFLFRAPEVDLTLVDASGKSRERRILTETADAPFLIGAAPRDTADFVRLMNGTLPDTTVSMSLHTTWPEAFAPVATVRFTATAIR